jgi:hypothetical protein
MNLTPSVDICNKDELRNALISALGETCADFLELRFPCFVDNHTISREERARALRHGRSFCELILDDGVVDTSCLNGALAHRQRANEEREQADSFVEHATAFCESMHVLLSLLAQFCLERQGSHQTINLLEVAASQPDDPESTFFTKLDFCDGQQTGDFSARLSEVARHYVRDWLLEFEEAIRREFEIEACEEDRRGFLSSMREQLATLISDHVCLAGLYDAQLKRRHHALNAVSLSNVQAMLFNDEIKELCEQTRQATIHRLRSLLPFCANGMRDAAAAAEAAASNRDCILEILQSPPIVLSDRAGFNAEELQFDYLRSIVQSSRAVHRDELIKKLLEWKTRVTKQRLINLQDWVDAAVELMKMQKVGFLPTLSNARPPDPPWTNARLTAKAYMFMRMKTTKQLLNMQSCVYTPMPPDVHLAMRLLSAVWECLGSSDLNSVLFQPGRLQCHLVFECVQVQQIKLNQALLTLRSCAQQIRLGENYRNAVRQLREFRTMPKREEALRKIVRKLAPFSLSDIMTVAHEESPLFYMYEFRVLDRTLTSMQSKPKFMFTELVRQALQHLCPVVCDLRRESMLSPTVSSNSLLDGLLSIREIREWNRDTNELVLTNEQAKGGLAGVKKELLALSSSNRLVHFGRRPASERKTWGNQRVFTLNGNDLRLVLAGKSNLSEEVRLVEV